MVNSREEKLEKILASLIQPAKNIPFEIVIRALFSVKVKKYNLRVKENKNQLKTIAQAMSDVCKAIQKQPIKKNRPNEVGNAIEPFIIKALNKNKLKASIPQTRAGKRQSAAYPDIQIKTKKSTIYLEVKTYAKPSKKQSLRSFYLSPSKNPKVTETAFHLAVAFEIAQKGKLFYPKAFQIIDLYGLECDMKVEFNSDNKRLYQKNRVLIKGNKQGFNAYQKKS